VRVKVNRNGGREPSALCQPRSGRSSNSSRAPPSKRPGRSPAAL